MPEERCGLDEDNVTVAVSSKSLAYYYQVIYRVGCPTHNFDCENGIIDFELLDTKMERIGDKVRFSLTDTSGTKLNEFICNLYVISPLATPAAVRTSHSRSAAHSGVFLFDVLINFIAGPERFDTDYQSDPYTITPHIADVSSIADKRLKIFAYIQSAVTDYPKVFTKLGKRANVHLPPFPYPQVSHAFMKILLWLACTQTLCLTIKLLSKTPPQLTAMDIL